MTKLPPLSVRIGMEDDPDFILLELNYSTITTPIAMKARRDIGAVSRAVEQWDSVLRKMSYAETERMADRIQFDEKRRDI